MPANRYNFRYHANEVASAQRTRFLQSTQLKLMLIVWVVSTLFFAAPMIAPTMFPQSTFSNWSVVLLISLAYLVTMLVLVYVTPYIDFAVNRFWRLPLTFQYNDKEMRLSVTGKTSGGLRLKWGDIRKVQENDRAFVLEYGTTNKFFILPKAAFLDDTQIERFRRRLANRLSVPVPGAAAAEPAPAEAQAPAGRKTRADLPAEPAQEPGVEESLDDEDLEEMPEEGEAPRK